MHVVADPGANHRPSRIRCFALARASMTRASLRRCQLDVLLIALHQGHAPSINSIAIASSVTVNPLLFACARAPASRSTRNACGVCARQRFARSTVSTRPGMCRLSVSVTGTAATAASAPARTAAIVASIRLRRDQRSGSVVDDDDFGVTDRFHAGEDRILPSIAAGDERHP